MPVERTPVESVRPLADEFLLVSQNWDVYQALNMHIVNEITKSWANIKYEEDLRDLRLWSGAPTGVRATWLISPKWLTFQAKEMHIRE